MAYERAALGLEVGEPTCWFLDVDRWWQDNPVPLFADRVNVWLLKLSGRSWSTEEAKNEVRKRLEGEIDAWFSYTHWGNARGSVEAVSYEIVHDPLTVRAKYGAPLADARNTVDPTLEWEKSDAPEVYVLARFVYRGSLQKMGWPTYRTGFGWACPKDVNLSVYQVFSPEAGLVKEDPCSVTGAWMSNPACKPFVLSPSKWVDLTEWPWWFWLALGGTTLYFTWPVLARFAAKKAASAGKRKASSDKLLTPNRGKKKYKRIKACWPGYEAYGFKKKRGRRVPNCVPKKGY